jgi:hypothetical protein
MLSLIFASCLAQSKDLNPGPDVEMPLDAAVRKWSVFVTRGASPDYAPALGKTREEIRTLRNRIGKRMVQPDLDHLQGTSVEFLGQKIKKALDAEISDLSLSQESALYKFCLAEAVSDWVRSHVVTNRSLVKGTISQKTGISEKEEWKIRSEYWVPVTLLQKRELYAVCAGYSRLTYHVSRSLGLPVYNVIGYSRSELQNKGTNHSQPEDHSWDVLVLEGVASRRLLLFIDTSHGRVGLSKARTPGYDWVSPHIFPDTLESTSCFHYWHFASKIEDKPELISLVQPLVLSQQDWRQSGTVKSIDVRRGQYFKDLNSATTEKLLP